jgi:hypothetical protein
MVLKNIFWSMPLILFLNTQTMHIRKIIHNSIAMFSQKPYTLAGIEPGSSVPEGDKRS